jgi:intracellular sulfur oxidation DsrE/DsrF family protein
MTKYGRVMWVAIAAATLGGAALAFVGPRVDADARKQHRLLVLVNCDVPATMNLALNNATDVEQYYKDAGEKVQIEIVTFGPGLHMLRDDTSPVKDRIKAILEKTSSISFDACGNTQEKMGRPRTRRSRWSRRLPS